MHQLSPKYLARNMLVVQKLRENHAVFQRRRIILELSSTVAQDKQVFVFSELCQAGSGRVGTRQGSPISISLFFCWLPITHSSGLCGSFFLCCWRLLSRDLRKKLFIRLFPTLAEFTRSWFKDLIFCILNATDHMYMETFIANVNSPCSTSSCFLKTTKIGFH